MSLFAVADTHLSFGLGVDKPMSVFGASWDNYEARLKEAWLDLVRPEDTVIVAGDISWGLKLSEALPDLLWLASLPGEKLILRGNHDLWWSSMAKMKDIHPTLHFIQNSSWLGDGFIVLGSRGWLCPGGRDFTEAEDRKIYERELLRLELCRKDADARLEEAGLPPLAPLSEDNGSGRPVVVGAMHFPPTNEKKQPSGFTDFFTSVGASHVVYGHLHGEPAFYNGPYGLIGGAEYRLCSLDRLDCVPAKIL